MGEFVNDRRGGMHGEWRMSCSLLYLREHDAGPWPILKGICNANETARLPPCLTNLQRVPSTPIQKVTADWTGTRAYRSPTFLDAHLWEWLYTYLCVWVSHRWTNPLQTKRVSAVTSVQQYATENTDTSLQAGLYFKLYFKRALLWEVYFDFETVPCFYMSEGWQIGESRRTGNSIIAACPWLSLLYSPKWMEILCGMEFTAAIKTDAIRRLWVLVHILHFDYCFYGISWKIGSSSKNSCEDGNREKERLVGLDYSLVVRARAELLTLSLWSRGVDEQ